jgi:hypothetical protein
MNRTATCILLHFDLDYDLKHEGPCGSTMPTARYIVTYGAFDPKLGHSPLLSRQWLPSQHEPEALILAWKGETIPAGCDAADRLLHGMLTHPATPDPEERCAATVRAVLAGSEEARGYLETMFDPLGEILVLDIDPMAGLLPY